MNSSPLLFQVPLATEVLLANQDLVTSQDLSLDILSPGLLVHLDVRLRDWPSLLGLPTGTHVVWEKIRTIDVQDLSAFVVPICYRVTFGDPYYRIGKKRHYFGLRDHLVGLDLDRCVTTVALRAAVLLSVLGGVGLRQVVWLLSTLFHLETSKSALDRWVVEAASCLPNNQEIVTLLMEKKPITEAHFDEIFPKGKKKKKPVLVVRDEHGRILVTEEVEQREIKDVVLFLQKLKGWGLVFKTFYIDHCASYAAAIKQVYPEAKIQYDYFHILQNVWRTIWSAFVAHRKEVAKRSEEVSTPRYGAKLEALAKRLWENRGLLFKFNGISEEDQQKLKELLAQDSFLGTMRTFLGRVRGIFTDSKGGLGARQRLGRLQKRPEVVSGKVTAFGKAVHFLESHFENMITFLEVPGVKRNSLAETGMRTLRRLEQGHDGFRSEAGRDRYVRLYQAIKYLGWDVQRRDGSLTIPESRKS